MDPLSESIMKAVDEAFKKNLSEHAESDAIYDIKEAAQFLRVSVSTVRNLIKYGDVPHHWISGQIRFFKKELRDWLKTNKGG